MIKAQVKFAGYNNNNNSNSHIISEDYGITIDSEAEAVQDIQLKIKAMAETKELINGIRNTTIKIHFEGKEITEEDSEPEEDNGEAIKF